MTSDEAKRILLAVRPGSVDEEDPEVRQAMRLVRSQPELQSWFQNHAAFQSALRAELRQIQPPADLRHRILAQRPIAVSVWRRPELWLAAACIALAFVILSLRAGSSSDERTLAVYRSRMVGFALRLYRMDIETNDQAQVRTFLRTNGAPADFALSPGLVAKPLKGGAKTSWLGHPVSMVCFDLSNKQTAYLFVIDSPAIPRRQRPGQTPVLTDVRGIMTAAWTLEGKVYLLAAPTGRSELQKLVGGQLNRTAVALLFFPTRAGSIKRSTQFSMSSF